MVPVPADGGDWNRGFERSPVPDDVVDDYAVRSLWNWWLIPNEHYPWRWNVSDKAPLKCSYCGRITIHVIDSWMLIAQCLQCGHRRPVVGDEDDEG